MDKILFIGSIVLKRGWVIVDGKLQEAWVLVDDESEVEEDEETLLN